MHHRMQPLRHLPQLVQPSIHLPAHLLHARKNQRLRLLHRGAHLHVVHLLAPLSAITSARLLPGRCCVCSGRRFTSAIVWTNSQSTSDLRENKNLWNLFKLSIGSKNAGLCRSCSYGFFTTAPLDQRFTSPSKRFNLIGFSHIKLNSVRYSSINGSMVTGRASSSLSVPEIGGLQDVSTDTSVLISGSATKRNPVVQTLCAVSGVVTYGESLGETHSHATEDKDIIRLPRLFQFLQGPLAQLISVLCAPKSKEGYAAIGGGSPLHETTDEQVGTCDQNVLGSKRHTCKCLCRNAVLVPVH